MSVKDWDNFLTCIIFGCHSCKTCTHEGISNVHQNSRREKTPWSLFSIIHFPRFFLSLSYLVDISPCGWMNREKDVLACILKKDIFSKTCVQKAAFIYYNLKVQKIQVLLTQLPFSGRNPNSPVRPFLNIFFPFFQPLGFFRRENKLSPFRISKNAQVLQTNYLLVSDVFEHISC